MPLKKLTMFVSRDANIKFDPKKGRGVKRANYTTINAEKLILGL